jgi:hypothetical protein
MVANPARLPAPDLGVPAETALRKISVFNRAIRKTVDFYSGMEVEES